MDKQEISEQADILVRLSPKQREVAEALGEDDETPLRSLRAIAGEDHHEDPAPNEREQVQDEDDRTSSPAPWKPVPLRQARQFVKDHPEAAIDLIFPAVYEEDRTAKLRDLGTSQALGAISHRRMSEMMAKELGIDPYDYADEMEQIEQEEPPIDPAKTLGSGDNVMRGMLGPLGGSPQPPAPDAVFPPEDVGGGDEQYSDWGDSGNNGWGSPDAPQSPSEGGVKRAQVSGPVQAEFRRQQREAEAVQSLVDQIKDVKASMEQKLELAERQGQAKLVEQLAATVKELAGRIEKLTEAARPAEPPVVNVTVENQAPVPHTVVRTVERDKGLISKIIEAPVVEQPVKEGE